MVKPHSEFGWKRRSRLDARIRDGGITPLPQRGAKPKTKGGAATAAEEEPRTSRVGFNAKLEGDDVGDWSDDEIQARFAAAVDDAALANAQAAAGAPAARVEIVDEIMSTDTMRVLVLQVGSRDDLSRTDTGGRPLSVPAKCSSSCAAPWLDHGS